MGRLTLFERFWRHVPDRPLFECWDWIGAKSPAGYGKIGHNRDTPATTQAQRIAYQLVYGPVARDLTIDHLCRNRGCVNPLHMEPVSRGENVLRGEGPSAQCARRQHCPRGHAYDGLWRNGRRYVRGCRRCARERMRLRVNKVHSPLGDAPSA